MTTASITACVDAVTSPRALNGSSPVAGFDVDAMTFTSIDFPGATSTFAMDINASDEVVGRYAVGGQTHGFLRDAEGNLTTIDYPGASFTVAAGINSDGDIVGMYALPSAPTERHGYLLQDGVFLHDRSGRVEIHQCVRHQRER
jgi:hypothetical protein